MKTKYLIIKENTDNQLKIFAGDDGFVDDLTKAVQLQSEEFARTIAKLFLGQVIKIKVDD